MSIITLNKKTMQQLVGKKLADADFKKHLPAMGIEVEAVLAKDIEVDISPNRPDWLSEQGIARSLRSFLGKKASKPFTVSKGAYKVLVDKSVAKVRPFTACAVVHGLKLDDEKIRELIQVQEKLHMTYCRQRKKAAIGVYPMEKISWPIRYCAKRPGEISFQPLEADREMRAAQILAEHPAGKEYGRLLQGQEKYPLFIDGKNQVLSMPPIINSQLTGKVTSKTKDVFVECSGFDLNNLKTLLNIIVAMLADMGGKVSEVQVKYATKTVKTPDLTEKTMKLDKEYVNKVLGTELTEKEVKVCLEKMGYAVVGKKVMVPAYRADVLHPVDLVEDVAIAYGYDNLRPEVPKVATIAQEAPFEVFRNTVCDMLVGLGLLETSTFHITNAEVQSTLMQHDVPLIALANALTNEYNALRAWMIPSLLEVLKHNLHHEYPQKIFGTGLIFKENPKTETGIEEDCRLAVLLCHAKTDYTEVKQILDYVLRMLEMQYEVHAAEHQSFIPGRVSRVRVKNKGIAYMGELHPKVLQSFGIEQPVAALEINLTQLFWLRSP